MPFQKGNKLAERKGQGRIWTQAIYNALSKRSVTRQEALDELAEKLLKSCDNGDISALRELADRLQGKPAQDVNIGGQEDNPLVLEPCEALEAHIRGVIATREVIARVAEDRD